VAWHNHPPADGPPATVLNAIANLNRVRTFKRDAREAAILARHQRALAETRRRSELASAQAGLLPTGDVELVPIAQADRESVAAVSAEIAEHGGVVIESRDGASRATEGRADQVSAEVRLPATAATLSQWVSTWMKMCADGDLVLGPLNDDVGARARYNLSAKQLRNIRNAATSGALRRRACELGVPLPAGYLDRTVGTRINGHELIEVAGGAPTAS